jgi:hypothetical protein
MSNANLVARLTTQQKIIPVLNAVAIAAPLDKAGRLAVSSDEYIAAEEGRSIRRWLNEKTGVDGVNVLTDGPSGDSPGIYFNLSEGQEVYVTRMCFSLNTVSDSCRFEIGYTDAVNGGGNFTPVTHYYYYNTAAALDGYEGEEIALPASRIRWADGAKSVTFRVNANDANCSIIVAWYGYAI